MRPKLRHYRLVVGHAPCDITDPNQWIASYKYLPRQPRCRKVVQNRGVETWPNDGVPRRRNCPI